ncbi:hypothetical protein PC123_g24238 [Phytophthora cactorum]|nr:hypothetical protein PC123_g24238 [Phytophthora cactorum]
MPFSYFKDGYIKDYLNRDKLFRTTLLSTDDQRLARRTAIARSDKERAWVFCDCYSLFEGELKATMLLRAVSENWNVGANLERIGHAANLFV